jgi:GntR family transcriptional regulator/MocR family aminotransferase
MIPLQLQPESHVPLYMQIRDQLRALVHTGELRPGDRIPASRELATQLGVHRTTVANAYAELESEGLIRGHVGRGTYIQENGHPVKVSPPPPAPLHNGSGVRWESLFADERGEESLLRLCPPGPPAPISLLSARPASEHFPMEDFRQACNLALKTEGTRILELGASDGYRPLKQALGEMLRAEGISAQEDQLLITGGVQQSLDLLCKAFLRPGDAVAMENPAYPGTIAIFAGSRIRALGVGVLSKPEANGHVGMDLHGLESVLMQNRVKLILTNPDFQNPTGTTMPVAARRRLLEIAARHQVPIVEDHICGRLRLRGNKVPSLKSLDRHGVVIQIDSFSKVAFPGLRVGWVVGPENVIERLRLVKLATDLHTDQLAQAAMAEFLRRGFFARHLGKMREVYSKRLAALEEALVKHMPEGTEWTLPEGGMCLWAALPPGYDASELLIHVRDRGVAFAPGRYFYFQSPVPNTLRLGFAAVEEKKIARGVAIIAEQLRLEMRKRQRGWRRETRSAVTLV